MASGAWPGALCSVFADNDVDLEALRLLTEGDLEKLGVSLGNRRKLLKALSELNEGQALAPKAQAVSDQLLSDHSLDVQAERRQLTVLFCDMVGFTELANRGDPEVLQRIIRSYEDTCAAAIMSRSY